MSAESVVSRSVVDEVMETGSRTSHLFTSESVTEGHPDKIADQISDTILDAAIEQDPRARVACETLVTTGLVVVAGEITTDTYVDIPTLVREKVSQIGYTRAKFGFDAETCGVIVSIDPQSADIAQGVDRAADAQIGESAEMTAAEINVVGSYDQGMMFGYAVREPEELMPMPISLALALTRRLTELRKSGELSYLRPVGKSQVTVRCEGARPVGIDKVLISAQHQDGMESQIKGDLLEAVIEPVMPEELFDKANTDILVNPTGRFVTGGPQGDCGLTGRKIIVDTYGGAAPHGGGAFSGKDPSKVDRSAAYAARYVAKNIVASGLATKAQVQVSYAIGVAKPTSIMVTTFGTGKVSDEKLEELVAKHFDLRPKGIIQMLDLLRPIYAKTASYGHFGRSEPEFSWEKTDKADALAADAGVKRAANG